MKWQIILTWGLLLVFQYAEPEKGEVLAEEFSVVSATPGELFMVERLIWGVSAGVTIVVEGVFDTQKRYPLYRKCQKPLTPPQKSLPPCQYPPDLPRGPL